MGEPRERAVDERLRRLLVALVRQLGSVDALHEGIAVFRIVL